MSSSLQPLTPIEEALQKLQHPRRFTLRFAVEMEEAFQKARLPRRIARYRESMWLGIFLFNIFLISDFKCLRPWFWICLFLRLGLNTPLALLGIYGISRVGQGAREFLFAFSAIPATISAIYLYNAQVDLFTAAQSVVILMMLFAINALRPDFRYACVATPLLAIGYSLYVSSLPALNQPIASLFLSITFAVAALSLLSCYRLELEERIAYLLQRRIEEQNAVLGRINEELTKISLIDPLTGIPNRRAFNNEYRAAWDRALRRKQPLAVLMIDLDFFKALNDRHGHDYGDRALCAVAHALRDALRSQNDILARYGGEEFIALLPNQSLQEAQQIAARLCASVSNTALTPQGNGLREQATISVGVAAVLPGTELRASELLRAADVALYKAKDQGRNGFYPPMN